MDVDGQFRPRECASDRIGRGFSLLDSGLDHGALVVALYGDHEGARRGDRSQAECDARNRRFSRHRVGQYAQSPSLLWPVHGFVEIWPRENRSCMPVSPNSQKTKVERPVQILHQGIG